MLICIGCARPCWCRSISRWRRPRRWSRSPLSSRPHALLPGAGAPRGAHHRGRAGRDRRGIDLARKVERLAKAGIRVSLFVAPDEDQIARAADIGAAVIEPAHRRVVRHFSPRARRPRPPPSSAGWSRRPAGHPFRAGDPCRARPGLPDRRRPLPALRSPRTQYRTFPHWRGDFDGLEVAVRRMREAMARADVPSHTRQLHDEARMILGIAPTSPTPGASPKFLNGTASAFSSVSSPRRAGKSEASRPAASRATPSASPPRKPAPRRWGGARPRGVLARHGRGQPALGSPDHGTDRRRSRAGSTP